MTEENKSDEYLKNVKDILIKKGYTEIYCKPIIEQDCITKKYRLKIELNLEWFKYSLKCNTLKIYYELESIFDEILKQIDMIHHVAFVLNVKELQGGRNVLIERRYLPREDEEIEVLSTPSENFDQHYRNLFLLNINKFIKYVDLSESVLEYV